MTSMLLTARYAAAIVLGTADMKRARLAPRPVFSVARYFSLEQSRGVILFSFAYCAAEASTMGRTIDWSVEIQSEIGFHCLPSHCWNLTGAPPSWSMHDTLSGAIRPT